MELLKMCPSCKQAMPDVYSFCGYCGTALDGVKKKKRKQSRRPKGDGSVRYIPGRRNPYAAYLPGKGGKYIGSFATSAEASKALAVAISERPSSKRAEWTVGDFYKCYTSSPEFTSLDRSTQNNARAAWKYCEDIAGMSMREAKAQEWQACIDNAVALGLSISTCKKIRTLASQLCKEAMKDDVINKNYATLLRVSEGAEQKEKDVFTKKEIDLLKKHDGDPRIKFILILIYTGMRISELLELTCDRVYDGYLIGGKKTKAGKNRLVPILPEIVQYIAYFNRGTGLLIHDNGRNVDVKKARKKWFYEPLAELGILTLNEILPGNTARLTPHCTRHSFASLAFEAGVSKEVITRVIGHTDFKTTDRIYIQTQADYLSAELMKMSSAKTA